MRSALAQLFMSGPRRVVTSSLSLLLMALLSLWVVDFIDRSCDSPPLAFGAILGWISALAGLTWLFVMATSPQLIVPSVLSDWARDPWRDEQLPIELPTLDELDPRRYQVNPQGRFKVVYGLVLGGALMSTHLSFDGFLTRFQREGSARVALRSPLREVRLNGLEQLVTRVRAGRKITPSAQLSEELVGLLADPDLGVRERVAFVIGAINLTSGVKALATVTAEARGEGAERLTKAALLALGQMQGSIIDERPARDALIHLGGDPELMKRAPYELAIALGLQRAQAPKLLAQLYSLALGVGGDVKVREAAIWALGEARDSDTINEIARGLSDPALSVRCLAANALEKLTAFETSRPLREAWAGAKKEDQCPLIETPEGVGQRVTMMPDWGYQHTIIHALASTDDPLLLTWLVEHQREVAPLTHRLMKKYYEALTARDKEGLLEEFKRRNRATRESGHE